MVRTDPASQNNVRKGLLHAAHAAGATVSGTGVATDGWMNALVVLDIGTMANSDDTVVNVQGADTVGGAYTTITGAVFTIATGGGDDDTVQWGVVRLQHQPAFIRVQVVAGATGTSELGASIVFFHPKDSRPTEDMLAANDATFNVLS